MQGIEVQDKHTHKKSIRKIPPSIIKNCYGLAVFTSMRSGIAPLGGAGGAGLVVAHNPETGWWSPPASISPNTFAAGLILGVDIYDCVLILNSPKAIETFKTHKVTLGADIAVAAGPWGAGAAMESGKERVAVFSYVKSRGLYAGVEAVGQVFLSRFDENERVYHWPGVKAGDILTGHVKMPREAKPFIVALEDAACGKAQMREGPPPEDPMFRIAPLAAAITLDDGEVLKLPPTPEQTDGHEYESDPETQKVIRRMTLPSNFSPPPVEKAWTPPLPPPRHGSGAGALHHPKPIVKGGPLPTLPPRRKPMADSASSSPLSGSPILPPRRSIEMPPTPTSPGSPASTAPAVASKPPPLPPRSRNRPPSMAIPPTPVSPTSPLVAAERAHDVADASRDAHSVNTHDIPAIPEFTDVPLETPSTEIPAPEFTGHSSPEIMNVADLDSESARPSYAPAHVPATAQRELEHEDERETELEQHLAAEHATAQEFDDTLLDGDSPAVELSDEDLAAYASATEHHDSDKPAADATEASEEQAKEEKQEKSQEESKEQTTEKADEAKPAAEEEKDDRPELPTLDFSKLRGEAGNLGFRR